MFLSRHDASVYFYVFYTPDSESKVEIANFTQIFVISTKICSKTQIRGKKFNS